MRKIYLIIFVILVFSLVSSRVLQISENEEKELQAAREDGDISHCEKIQGGDGRDLCYDVIVGKSSNPDVSLCRKISAQDIRNPCYNSASFKLKDPSICKEILGDQHLSDLCYTNAAIAKFDVSFCNNIVSTSQKDFCYEEIAKKKKDPSICNDIKGGRHRDSCFSALDAKDPTLPDYTAQEGQKEKRRAEGKGLFNRVNLFFKNLFTRNKPAPDITECNKDELLRTKPRRTTILYKKRIDRINTAGMLH